MLDIRNSEHIFRMYFNIKTCLMSVQMSLPLDTKNSVNSTQNAVPIIFSESHAIAQQSHPFSCVFHVAVVQANTNIIDKRYET